MTATPGYKTTEFWLTATSNVSAILAALGGVLEPETAAIVLAVSNGLYAFSRSLAKKAPAVSVNSAAASSDPAPATNHQSPFTEG